MESRAKRQRLEKEKPEKESKERAPVSDQSADVGSGANAAVKQAARTEGASKPSVSQPSDSDAAEEAENSFPKPTAYLYGSENSAFRSKSVQLPDLALATRLTTEEYREARSSLLQCNLQLKSARARPSELELFSAVLPAIDACRLSPVINVRLQRWLKPTAEGRTQLALQVAVSQEILDMVVWAVYNKRLAVTSKNAENLLLLADYLQMSWLSDAVACFAKELLLDEPLPGVSKLATAYPCLGIFPNAVLELMAARPDSEALVEIVAMASTDQRDIILGAAAQLLTSARRLDLLLGLSRHPDVQLSHQEAMILHQPSSMPRQSSFSGVSDAVKTAKLSSWAEAYMEQQNAAYSGAEASGADNFLVWDVPLEKAKKENLHSDGTLTSPDGRKFCLSTSAKEENVGLNIQPVEGSLETGDRFRIFAIGDIGSPRDTRVVVRVDGCCWGLPGWITRRGDSSNNTVCDGKYLPVALQML